MTVHRPRTAAILAHAHYEQAAADRLHEDRESLAKALLEIDCLRSERDSARRELADVRLTLERTRATLNEQHARARDVAEQFREMLADPAIYASERVGALAAGML